jgi:hypothetical protein
MTSKNLSPKGFLVQQLCNSRADRFSDTKWSQACSGLDEAGISILITNRLQMRSALKKSLHALLVGLLTTSIVVAGGLVAWPGLHAALHADAKTACCTADCSPANDCAPPSSKRDPGSAHVCLIELLAAGTVDGAGLVEVGSRPILVELAVGGLGEAQVPARFSHAATPGRAPPVG